MPTHVRVRLSETGGRGSVETSALINTGFETPEPEIALPAKLAEKLGLYPSPEGSTIYEFIAFGGLKTKATRVPKAVTVNIVAKGARRAVKATAAISEAEEEAIISDKLASRLGVVPEDPGAGRWRFRWESPRKLRRGAKPEYWL